MPRLTIPEYRALTPVGDIHSEHFAKLFWPKVNKTDTCWLWTAATNKYGYGNLFYRYRMYTAHKLSYRLHKGEVPEGLVIDHICRNRHCVNPDHLEVVTNRENIIRGKTSALSHLRKPRAKSGGTE